jgi:hypothetical protein
MSTFRTTVLAIESAARVNGLRSLKMSTLRNAIAYAIRGRSYSDSVAADRAGELPPVALPSPDAIAAVAERYRLSPQEHAAFVAAFKAMPSAAAEPR